MCACVCVYMLTFQHTNTIPPLVQYTSIFLRTFQISKLRIWLNLLISFHFKIVLSFHNNQTNKQTSVFGISRKLPSFQWGNETDSAPLILSDWMQNTNAISIKKIRATRTSRIEPKKCRKRSPTSNSDEWQNSRRDPFKSILFILFCPNCTSTATIFPYTKTQPKQTQTHLHSLTVWQTYVYEIISIWS